MPWSPTTTPARLPMTFGGQEVGRGQAHALQHEHGRVDTACPGPAERASGPVIVIDLSSFTCWERDERAEGLIHHRERVSGQGVLGGGLR